MCKVKTIQLFKRVDFNWSGLVADPPSLYIEIDK